MKTIGTISRGIKTPLFKAGDPLPEIVADSLLAAAEEGRFEFQDRDVVAMTEAIVARTQGNYATLDQLAADVRQKFGPDAHIGLVFPILSRNRFSMILKGIARGAKKLTIQLSYPKDEVGNPLVSQDLIDEAGIDPFRDAFTEAQFRKVFPDIRHPFTGMDYIQLFKEMAGAECECEIVLSNRLDTILDYTPLVIAADIHTRKRTRRILLQKGAQKVLGLDELLDAPVDGSGYNEQYGVLGSNLATDNSIKLFPRDCQPIVDKLQRILLERTGKHIEVMVYGDGAFKDPVGGIWELADPVVSPAYTPGLAGKPNEIKLKYLVDNQLGDLRGDAAKRRMQELIRQKKADLVADMSSQGTTPRRLVDLLGSLCDLTSGSGDKGTPVILIQNYFDNYATD